MMEPGFYNMDCMEGMKQFPDKFFDLAIVDPPYGINVANHKGGKIYQDSKSKKWRKSYCCEYHVFDDSVIPESNYFELLFRVSKKSIIWGGNYFLDYLGKTSCLIIWDKGRRGMDQADCEIAWTNLEDNNRIISYLWNGFQQQDIKNKEKRIHPTQKPIAIYAWLIKKFAKPGMKILDTHVGSASSLIACHRAGLDFWGFEIDPVYYKMAKERLQMEQAQVNMFDVMKEIKTEQVSLI